MKTTIVAFDGFTDIDVFILWDLLNRVPVADWRVEIVADTPDITSSTGLTIPAHDGLESVESADAVLIATGKDIAAKLDDEAFLAPLRRLTARQLIGAIDSGALMLGKLGLLQGRRATTYPTHLKALAALGATVVKEPFVREGNVATAAGCLACQDPPAG